MVEALPVLAQELQMHAVALDDVDQLELDLSHHRKAEAGLDVLLLAAIPDIGRLHLLHPEGPQTEAGFEEGRRAVEVLHDDSDL
jgi:hypothetical protein